MNSLRDVFISQTLSGFSIASRLLDKWNKFFCTEIAAFYISLHNFCWIHMVSLNTSQAHLFTSRETVFQVWNLQIQLEVKKWQRIIKHSNLNMGRWLAVKTINMSLTSRATSLSRITYEEMVQHKTELVTFHCMAHCETRQMSSHITVVCCVSLLM